MKKVIKILEKYDDNKTLKDGFAVVLDTGEEKEISRTEWQTEEKKIAVEGGVVFEGDIFFEDKIVEELNLKFY